jgi:polyhydroxyalkanoate synthesis regulator phasin
MDAPGSASEPEPEERGPDGQALERLVSLLSLRLDEARSLVEETTSRWRGDAVRVGEGTRHRLHDVFRELGLVTREEWDELELRLAQVEHRLRLLEDRADTAP